MRRQRKHARGVPAHVAETAFALTIFLLLSSSRVLSRLRAGTTFTVCETTLLREKYDRALTHGISCVLRAHLRSGA